MHIRGVYSLNEGLEILEAQRPSELEEIKAIIASINAAAARTKFSAERTMPGRALYSPRALNKAYDRAFRAHGWRKHRVYCEYPTSFYVEGYTPPRVTVGAFREIDFVKERVGVEVQFGKYAFMVYNVAAKMTIFHNLDVIDVGVEIVPLKEMADEMSTGVSYFEQLVWDLEHRGVADIDIPILVLGVIP